MKKIFSLLSVLFCSVLSLADITIVANPANFGTIEKAACAEKQVNFWDADKTDDRACTESFAAVELKTFLIKVAESNDTNIKFAATDSMPAKGDVFLLGSLTSNKLIAELSKGKDFNFTTDESFNIRTVKDAGRTITIIQGSDRVGTLYGVYEYLNKLGIRFFGLGEQGTAYPENKVSLLNDIDVTQNPDYLTRGFWVTCGPKHDPNDMHLWMARNKLNFWTMLDHQVHKVKKLGFILCVGEHVNQLLYINTRHEYPYNSLQFTGDEDKPSDPYKPSDQYQGDKNNDGKLSYFEAHREWYGLIDGKRSDNFTWNGHNFCTSNIDAATEFGKNMAESIANGEWKYADVVNFWMFDTHTGW
ncbi:MAG TPA: alpha-glucuronidase family glycosyl hydrolase, partial [Sedimentisphaerales bacterium]|nr:alpha-glucuronidase family glycosyl hydrolase [Sedimentisphaerales bacterium]